MKRTHYTLKDHLSHLKYRHACQLLGADGAQLILKGGKFNISLDKENVTLSDHLFWLLLTVVGQNAATNWKEALWNSSSMRLSSIIGIKCEVSNSAP